MLKIMTFRNCVVVLFILENIFAKSVVKNFVGPFVENGLVDDSTSNKNTDASNETGSSRGTSNENEVPNKVPLNKKVAAPVILIQKEVKEKETAPAFGGVPPDLDHKPWPLGVVPYYVNHSSYDEIIAERIRQAMNSIEEASCVQFTPLNEAWSDDPWIHITNPFRLRDCVHENSFKAGTEKLMVLGFDCMQRRDILHSLMHALGFKDEVTHPQRDKYIRIKWENIHPKYRQLFHINHYDFPTRTTEYDPSSIMQFYDRAFTRNGQATITSLIPGLFINPSKELSPLDKMKLRVKFGHECNKRKVEDLVDQCKYALQPASENDGEDRGDGNDNGGTAGDVPNSQSAAEYDNDQNNDLDDDQHNNGDNQNQGIADQDAPDNDDKNANEQDENAEFVNGQNGTDEKGYQSENYIDRDEDNNNKDLPNENVLRKTAKRKPKDKPK